MHPWMYTDSFVTTFLRMTEKYLRMKKTVILCVLYGELILFRKARKILCFRVSVF